MVDDETMAKIFYLSRLSVGSPERAETAAQIQRILSYFEMLSKYDTATVDIDLGEAVPPGSLRRDEPQPGLTTKQVKSFAVGFLDGYFSVPRILDEEP